MAKSKRSPTGHRGRNSEAVLLDHRAVAGLPEYQAAARAIQELAQRLDRLEADGREAPPRSEFVVIVRQLAELAREYHTCHDCHREGKPIEPWPDGLLPPVLIVGSETGLGYQAEYRWPDCYHIGHWYFDRERWPEGDA